MRKTGIWLDNRSADLIILFKGKVKHLKIESKLDESQSKGGYGSSVPYLGQIAVSEQKKLERKKQQMKAYFSEINQKLHPTSFIYIFGPGTAKDEFQKYLFESSTFKSKIMGVETADSMTDKQKVAAVKSFYNNQNTI